ncbi:MAG: DUF1499 domain-containing protein [Deltaproteobacteria bacterium]|nr:DUF1499 domain-containing protein [Deltaproteobacteria bacterium]
MSQPAPPASPAVSATVALSLGITCFALMGVGTAGALSGALTPFIGFRIFGMGLLVGLAALLFGITGVLRTRASSGRAGARRAWGGLALGALALLVLAVSAAPGAGLPAINDITTNPDDPPAFSALARQAEERDAPMKPLDRATIDAQKAAYDDLAPIQLDLPPREALERAHRVALELGWTVVASDPAAGRIEAIDVTGIFQFVDDVVIRVRPSGSGCVVDVRSKSRVGKGDVGANAARIRAFREALTSGS